MHGILLLHVVPKFAYQSYHGKCISESVKSRDSRASSNESGSVEDKLSSSTQDDVSESAKSMLYQAYLQALNDPTSRGSPSRQ